MTVGWILGLIGAGGPAPALWQDGRPLSFAVLARCIAAVRTRAAQAGLPRQGLCALIAPVQADAVVASLGLRAHGLDVVCLVSADMLAGLGTRPPLVVTLGVPDAEAAAAGAALVLRGHELLAGPAIADEPPGEGCAILLSSGTTGKRKMIRMGAAAAEARARRRVPQFGLRAGTIQPLGNRALDSGAAWNGLCAAWLTGGTMAFTTDGRVLDGLDPKADTAAVVTIAQLVAMVEALPPDAQPRENLRLYLSGATVPAAIARRAYAGLTTEIFDNFGSIEMNCVLLTRMGPDGRIEWRNVAPEREVQVVGPDGVEVAPFEMGELRVRLDEGIESYLDDPVATARHFRDGWFHTNDLAMRDEAGRVRIMGRAGDTVNLPAGRLAVAPIEQAVQDRLGVTAACLVQGTEAGALHLVIETPAPLDGAALRQVVAEEAGGLGPVHVHLRASLPRGATGKLDRFAIVRAIEGAR